MSGTDNTTLPVVGLAMFGMGKIGSMHYENLRKNPRARIYYFVEEFDQAIAAIRSQWGVKESETKSLKPSEEDIVFNDSRIDAVWISAPALAHEHIIIKALEHGKAVFCEKPLSLSVESVQRIVAASKKYSKPLLCGFNRRFDPGLVSLKERMDEGELGELRVVRTVSRDPPHVNKELNKVTGGIFYDCSIHDIDLLCWFVGQYPESVISYGHTFNRAVTDEGNFDTIIIVMKFPNGAMGEIEVSRHAVYGYDQRVEVFGTQGLLTCESQRPIGVKHHDAKGTHSVPIHFRYPQRYREAYIAEVEHFLNVVQGLEPCRVTREELLASTIIATVCKEAANSGKSVALSWDTLKNI